MAVTFVAAARRVQEHDIEHAAARDNAKSWCRSVRFDVAVRPILSDRLDAFPSCDRSLLRSWVPGFRGISNQIWVDSDTNWYAITCFRELALNVVGSMIKGQRIVVTGSLRIRDWESGDRAGTTVEVDAETIGHDLRFGTSTFIRSIKPAEEVVPSETVA